MIPSINLRGDLAKLSDAELAERLQSAWREFEAARRRQWRWFRSRRLPARGPIRHPRLYRLLMLLSGANELWTGLFAATIFSSKKYEFWLRRDPGADADLSACEIQDINDEIKRRLAQRNGPRV